MSNNGNDIYNSADAESILDAPDEEMRGPSGEQNAAWIKADDILYQHIVVTRASIADKYNQFTGKTTPNAYVNFFYADDESQTPFVFSTGWQAIRSAVARFNAAEESPYPVHCAVVEVLSGQPFNGHFPLRFVSLGKLQEAIEEMEASSALRQNPLTGPAAQPPEPPTPEPAPAPRPPVRSTATARTGATTAPRGSASPSRAAISTGHPKSR